MTAKELALEMRIATADIRDGRFHYQEILAEVQRLPLLPQQRLLHKLANKLIEEIPHD